MKDNVKKLFAKNLQYLMEKENISQADICRSLGMSSSTVSDWCKGEKFPRTDKVIALSELFGVRFTLLTSEDMEKVYDEHQRQIAIQNDPALLLDNEEKRLVFAFRKAEDMAKKIAIETLENNQKKDTAQTVI